ncbi:hypothetical protein JTB14_016646 [Gonioctena quinquepunctata]|nr:hypothetical protein JTB14_016646 [Gonioctena quinquepunctata]
MPVVTRKAHLLKTTRANPSPLLQEVKPYGRTIQRFLNKNNLPKPGAWGNLGGFQRFLWYPTGIPGPGISPADSDNYDICLSPVLPSRLKTSMKEGH